MDALAQQRLAAIIDNPDEDAPRLVYAEHLQQQGAPVAKFTAVQMALAVEPESPREGIRHQLTPHAPEGVLARKRTHPGAPTGLFLKGTLEDPGVREWESGPWRT